MKQISQTSRTAGKLGRIGAAAASAGLLFALSACGFNVQTLQPYTPSDGVNIDVGPKPNGLWAIKVRGLMILAKSSTSGFLSATIVAQQDDSLTSVTGNVLKPDGSNGDALTVKIAKPIKVGPTKPVILVDHSPVTVTGTSLPAGADANLTLTFDKAGSEQVRVPIVDGNNDIYATVSPSPANPTS